MVVAETCCVETGCNREVRAAPHLQTRARGLCAKEEYQDSPRDRGCCHRAQSRCPWPQEKGEALRWVRAASKMNPNATNSA